MDDLERWKATLETFHAWLTKRDWCNCGICKKEQTARIAEFFLGLDELLEKYEMLLKKEADANWCSCWRRSFL